MVRVNNWRLIIRIQKSEERIRLSTVFGALVVACLPFYTITIGGVGLLMLFGVPLLILSIPTLFSSIRRSRWNLATLLLVGFLAYNILAYICTPYFSLYSLFNYFKITVITLCLYCQNYNQNGFNTKQYHSFFLSSFSSKSRAFGHKNTS